MHLFSIEFAPRWIALPEQVLVYVRLPLKHVLDEMADKQKQDPGKAVLRLPRVLCFCVLYHIGSQKVVIW